MFGINGGEFLVILLVVVLVVGPERLPQYTEQLAKFVRGARTFITETKAKVDQELGPEFRDVDWQKLDPASTILVVLSVTPYLRTPFLIPHVIRRR